jgi:hypothetical protein
MSIEEIERYLQELEAIKNYAQVKQDREMLSRKIEELNVSLDNALREVSSLKKAKAKLDGAEMTLEEARLDFIQAQDAEIEKRAAARFEKLKADYESKMPELVYQRLSDVLKRPWLPVEIAKLIDTEAKKKADAILRDQNSWPLWFRKIYEEEVKKKVSAGLNQEFDARVETAAMAKAKQRLKELTSTEWPTWYRTNVAPKVLELENKITANALQVLKGPWVFTCDRCGTSFSDELTSFVIEALLRKGQVGIECSNAACEDRGLLSSRRHTFQVSLHELIESYISARS